MIAAVVHWCDPITSRLVENYDGYWHRYRWLLALTCVTAFADLLTTIHFMHADGIEHELHPAIRTAAWIMGPVAGPLLGKMGQLAAILLVTLYARVIGRYVYVAACIMYAWAAWYNVWGRDMYTPLLFAWLQ